MGELQLNNSQKNRPMMNRSPPPGGYQSFSRGLPCGSSLEVIALGRAITPFRVTAKSDLPAYLPKEAGQPVSPKGDWPGWELPLSFLLPKEYSVKGDSEESRSRGRLTDRAFPKIRSTQMKLSQFLPTPSGSCSLVYTRFSPVSHNGRN